MFDQPVCLTKSTSSHYQPVNLFNQLDHLTAPHLYLCQGGYVKVFLFVCLFVSNCTQIPMGGSLVILNFGGEPDQNLDLAILKRFFNTERHETFLAAYNFRNRV